MRFALPAAGQLCCGVDKFVLCRYVQHDEAASHYAAMIDQTTLGHM